MKTYKYINPDNTLVAVYDEDGISRISGLAAALVPEGATVEPYLEPPAPVPSVVFMRQAQIALLRAGLLDAVEAAIAAGSREDQITWAKAQTVERSSPLVVNMAAALNLSEADLDDLFTLASTL